MKHLEHVQVWLSPNLTALIVNTAAGCYPHGHALALNAVTPTCMLLLHVLPKKKANVSKVLKNAPFLSLMLSTMVKCLMTVAVPICASGSGYQLGWR